MAHWEYVIIFYHQGLNVDFDAIFQRELKLNFLQVITPGLVYPERSTRVVSADTGLGKDSLSDDGSFPPPPPGGKKKKKFKVEDYCLNWETIENMHLFIYPGMTINPSPLDPPAQAPSAPHSITGPQLPGPPNLLAL